MSLHLLHKTTEVPLLVTPQKSSSPVWQSPVLGLVPSKSSSTALLDILQHLRRGNTTLLPWAFPNSLLGCLESFKVFHSSAGSPRIARTSYSVHTHEHNSSPSASQDAFINGFDVLTTFLGIFFPIVCAPQSVDVTPKKLHCWSHC